MKKLLVGLAVTSATITLLTYLAWNKLIDALDNGIEWNWEEDETEDWDPEYWETRTDLNDDYHVNPARDVLEVTSEHQRAYDLIVNSFTTPNAQGAYDLARDSFPNANY